ncbi:hypothetical protein P4S63_22200 [Pseudoalteromonas sp. B193]
MSFLIECITTSYIFWYSFIFYSLKTNYLTGTAQQPAFIQNWLTNTGFEKQGVALIPDAKTGELSQVFCLMQSSDDFWAAGNLANTLPTGTYQIQVRQRFCRAGCFRVCTWWLRI